MSSIIRHPRTRLLLSRMFQAVQGSLGVSVTPSHFYFPIPDFRTFRRKDWSVCRPCSALDFEFDRQVELLDRDLRPFAEEWTFPECASADRLEFHFNNGFFERIDAEVAYSMVRRSKPGRIIEIGSGNTTLLLAAALQKNKDEGFPGELICIEPHPPEFLRGAVSGLTRLIANPVQQVPLELFRSLRANDILFIDSSHVVSMDSDVLYECLHILPELAPGVFVHFHDIFTPFDYPEKFVKTNLCFWSEQYLLEAFLSFNSSFSVVWSSSAMQQSRSEVLREVFPSWEGSFTRMPPQLKVFAPTIDNNRVWPCSFWILRNAS